MIRILKALGLLTLCLSAAACTALFQGKDEAESATATFHERFNAEEFDGIYADAAEAFRQATSANEFRLKLRAIRRTLGKVTESKTASWHVNTRNLTTYVRLIKRTRFENGSGTETFTYRMRDDRALLRDYEIDTKKPILGVQPDGEV